MWDTVQEEMEKGKQGNEYEVEGCLHGGCRGAAFVRYYTIIFGFQTGRYNMVQDR
jgi:hypothetical protein